MAEQGNVAAMRDALQQISLALWSEIDPGCNDDCCAPKRELARLADAALDAPARNADRFATTEEALDAFIREKKIKDEDVDGMNLRDFFDWLFASAE